MLLNVIKFMQRISEEIAPRCDQQDSFFGNLFLNTLSKLLSTFSAKFRQKAKKCIPRNLFNTW